MTSETQFASQEETITVTNKAFLPRLWTEQMGKPRGHNVQSMINRSGLRPLGHAILVEPYDPEMDKAKGLLVIPDTVSDRQKMVETRARIIDLGAEAWVEESRPRALPGEIVLISKYDGTVAKGPKDGKTYRLVNDEAIYCAVEEG